MTQKKSNDLLASSMNQIMASESHKAMFAKPQIKTASVKVHPVEQAFNKLVQASQMFEDLELSKSSARLLRLAQAIGDVSFVYDESDDHDPFTKEKYSDEPFNQPSITEKYPDFPTDEEIDKMDIYELRRALKDMERGARYRKEDLEKDLPYKDLMQQERSDIDPENLSTNNFDEEDDYFDEPEILIGEDGEKDYSEDLEFDSLFDKHPNEEYSFKNNDKNLRDSK